MANFEQLKEVVEQLNTEFPRPGILLGLGDLSPVATENMWQNADCPGVYFLFDANGELQYIGKASFGSAIGYRVGAKFTARGEAKEAAYAAVTQLATIALPKDRAFEASSIEEFLISRLPTPLNKIGN